MTARLRYVRQMYYSFCTERWQENGGETRVGARQNYGLSSPLSGGVILSSCIINERQASSSFILYPCCIHDFLAEVIAQKIVSAEVNVAANNLAEFNLHGGKFQ